MIAISRTAIAAIASTILVGASIAGATTASAKPPKPKVTLSAPTTQVTGKPIAFKVKAKNVTKGQKVVLQKQVGKWRSIKKLGSKGGRVGVVSTAGTWRFRVAVLKGKRVVSKSKAANVRVTPATFTVPFATICAQAVVTDGACRAGTSMAGGTLFPFTAFLNIGSPFSPAEPPRINVPSSSCTGLNLRVAGNLGAQMFGDTVSLRVFQDGAVIGSVSAPSGHVARLSVPLSRGAYFLQSSASDPDVQVLVDGEGVGCTTPSGTL